MGNLVLGWLLCSRSSSIRIRERCFWLAFVKGNYFLYLVVNVSNVEVQEASVHKWWKTKHCKAPITFKIKPLRNSVTASNKVVFCSAINSRYSWCITVSCVFFLQSLSFCDDFLLCFNVSRLDENLNLQFGEPLLESNISGVPVIIGGGPHWWFGENYSLFFVACFEI